MLYVSQVPKLHIKKDISKHMVKVFICNNVVIFLGFERSVFHFPKEARSDLFWKLIRAPKTYLQKQPPGFYKPICSTERCSSTIKQVSCFRCPNFPLFVSFRAVFSPIHRDASGGFPITCSIHPML